MMHIVGMVVLALLARADAPAWPAPPDAPRIRLASVLPVSAPPPATSVPLYLRAFRWLVGLPASGLAVPVAPLLRPTGVFVRGTSLYVADVGKRAVVQIDLATGRVVRSFPRDATLLASPVAVAVAADGAAFVSDSAGACVRVFGPDGRPRARLVPPGAPRFRPAGLALDERRGRLYVADTGEHRVHVFGLDGTYASSFGRRGEAAGAFNYPTYLWMDAVRDELLVCDSANFRVQRLSPDGEPRGRFGEAGDRPGFLARPRGVGVDSDHNVYVVDGALESVQVFDPQGRLALWFGESGADEGSFQLPGGIFIAGDDRIYVADTFNARVQVFEYLKGSKPAEQHQPPRSGT